MKATSPSRMDHFLVQAKELLQNVPPYEVRRIAFFVPTEVKAEFEPALLIHPHPDGDEFPYEHYIHSHHVWFFPLKDMWGHVYNCKDYLCVVWYIKEKRWVFWDEYINLTEAL